MRMNEHQKRLCSEMLRLIQSYIDGETSDFYSLVGKLEGALDAAEIKDKELVTQWYDFWTPLETRRAIEGNQVAREKAIQELETMKHFLKEMIIE